MNIHSSFPRYDAFNPLVPVWCITPNDNGCMHRFFDSSSISPSGRYLATFQLPFEDRQPKPGETGNVRLVDLETGENRIVAETCGWEPQLGANINWGATDHELFYNDVDTDTWEPFAWKLDPTAGARDRMEGTVYHASPDGKWLVSANLALMGKTQAGYGVVVPREETRQNLGLVEDDGFYITDTTTGQRRLLVSIRDLMTKADPPVRHEDIDNCEVYGFHSKFNSQGTRLMLFLRWFTTRDADVWNLCDTCWKGLRFARVTVSLDGGDIHCASGPAHYIKGSHHATWFPDGEHISMNLKLDGKNMRFARVKYDGSDLRAIVAGVRGSGHPTVHPNGNILTDTYLKAWDFPQYGDGTVPLRWVSMETGGEYAAIRIDVRPQCEDPVLRVDPHPAWDRTWRYITFNGVSGGTRRVFLADMGPLISGAVPPPPPPPPPRRKSALSRLRSRAGRILRKYTPLGSLKSAARTCRDTRPARKALPCYGS